MCGKETGGLNFSLDLSGLKRCVFWWFKT
jgi:hypothetical protein